MAENTSHDHFDDNGERHFDTREINFQCLMDKEDFLGFVVNGGVLLKDYKIEQGKWIWYGKCG